MLPLSLVLMCLSVEQTPATNTLFHKDPFYGHLLFLTSMNDLQHSSFKFYSILFPHDTTLFCKGLNVDYMIQGITNELQTYPDLAPMNSV